MQYIVNRLNDKLIRVKRLKNGKNIMLTVKIIYNIG